MRMTERTLQRSRRSRAASTLAVLGTLSVLLTASPAALANVLHVVADDNYPPFLFMNARGEPEGYVVDFWKLWSQKTGIAVELRPMEWWKAQETLQQGGADVIDMIYRTPEREKIYDYSKPYARLPVAIYSHRSITGLSRLENLHGFKVGVMRGDACIEYLQSRGISDLEYYPSYTELIKHAVQEHIKVFCLDEYPANYYLYQLKVQKTFAKAFSLYEGEFHRAVKKGHSELLALVQQGTDQLSEAELQALQRKWFGDPIVYGSYLEILHSSLIALAAIAVIMAILSLILRNIIKRKTAELERERNHLNNLLQAIPDPVWLKNPNGNYLFCNPAFAQLVGQPESSIYGKTDEQLFPAAEAAGYRNDDIKVIQSGHPFSIQEWITAQSHPHRQLFLTSKRPIFDAQGQLLGVLGMARNIHTLYATQRALGERIKERDCLYAVFNLTEDLNRPLPEMLQAVVERLPAGWQYPDLTAARIELDGQCYQSAALPEDTPCLEAPLLLDDHHIGRIVVGYLAPPPAQTDTPVFLTEEAQLLQAIAQRLVSVMQRRLVEEHARQREELFQAIITHASDCIMLLDVANLTFIEFNEAACNCLGYTREEFSRLRLPDIQRECDEDAIRHLIDEVLAHGSVSLQTQRRCKDGTLRDVKANLQRIILHGTDYISDIWRDITKQVQIDAKLRRINQIYSALAQSNEAILRSENVHDFLVRVCKIIVETGGMTMAWVGLVDDRDHQVRVVTRYGAALEYLDGLRISIDADDPYGRGPTGTAIRDNTPYWCNDNQQDSNLQPWLMRQRQFGFRASASIPINSLGRPIGALSLYCNQPYPFDDEERALLLEMATDIGFALDNLQSRQLLIDKEQQLRSLGDNLPNGFVYRYQRNRDSERRFLYLSAGVEKILGLTPEQVIADPNRLFSLMSDASARDYPAAEAASAEQLSDFHAVQQFYIPGRGERWLRVQSHPTRNEEGTVIWDGIVIDVTEQYLAEQELANYRHHLEELVAQRTQELDRLVREQLAIFESASSGIVLVIDQVVQRCNHKLEAILGYPPGRLTGHSTRLWYADDAAFIAAGAIYSRIWQGEYASLEQELVRYDGQRIWVRMTGHAIDIHDHSKGSVWIIDDISAERQATEALRRAKELAEEATKAKSNFLANMSHEIRTPMNAILGMLHLALKTTLTPAQFNYLTKAQNAAHSLLGLINDILDFSKIEAGKLELEQIEFSLDRVLEQVANTISYQAEQKGIEFLIRYDPSIPNTLIGDPLRLSQILINLCGNALKFTEHGEIELSFSNVKKTATEIQLCICVRDTGIGIAPALQDKLFQEFGQADQSMTRRFGGTGLGLAICKRLTELMHGRIWLEGTQPGAGATICFTVKLGISAEAQSHLRMLLEQTGDLLSNIHALVVDDNEVSREIIAEMLRFFRIHVATAHSGTQAIEMLEQQTSPPYDLVLMDWRMPQMNGDEAVLRIRRDPLIAPNPRIIMITAYGGDDVMRLADKAGVEGLLVKPITPSTLLDTVLSVLGRGRVLSDTIERAKLPETNTPYGPLRGAKILLVEDNAINREFARELLRGEGIEVDEAENGLIAVKKAETATYDALLMDIQMPELDGLEATRRIRALATRAPSAERRDYFEQLPIIAMTALAMRQDQANSLAAGMNDHINKPIDPEQLFTVLLNWIHPTPAATLTATETSAHDTPFVIPPDLQALTMLNAAEGLRRIGGNPDAYRKQLRRFCNHYPHAIAPLRQAIAQGDLKQAEAQCHALKGVLGNLAARRLYEQFCEVDRLLKQEQIPDAALLDALEQELHTFCAAITQHLGVSTPQAATPSPAMLDTTKLLAQLHTLSGTLDYNVGAIEPLVETLSAAFANTPYATAFTAIANDIDVFDFEQAQQKLHTLIEHLTPIFPNPPLQHSTHDG